MNHKQEAVLYRTNQAWKHYAAEAIAIFAFIVLVCSVYYFSAGSWQYGLGIAIAVMSSVVSLAIALSIKCPECGSRWFWLALKAPSAGSGIGKFLSQKNARRAAFQMMCATERPINFASIPPG